MSVQGELLFASGERFGRFKKFRIRIYAPQMQVLKNVLYSGHRESLGSGGLVGNVTAFIAVREQVIGWRYIIPFLWAYCVVQMEQVIDRMAYISGVHAIII